MNDIPGLRLAPTRMIALVGQRGRHLESVSPKSTPAESHAAGWSDPRVRAAKPLDVTEPTITNADTTPATQTRVARFTPNHSERMGDADGVPEVELSFGDFLDLINPLHHIPIIGTIYRAITGDQIGAPAKILGGLLFGGPLGFIVSIFDTIVAQATGRDLGATVMAALFDRDQAPAVQVADARDLEGLSVQAGLSVRDDAPEASPPTANGAPGPIFDHRDPFGLERGVATPIAVTPGALMPSPQAATVPGFGPGEKPFVPVARGPDAFPVPVAAGTPVVVAELFSANTPKPGTQRWIPGIATTDRGFSERMLEALDKYRALASERYRDNSRATRRLDLNL